jgi:transcriptional regulator with XRE-family HTH domain
MTEQTINPVNAYIGNRIRQARLMRDLSQAQLGKSITKPISFQQVQKYERGINRISVVLLEEFAQAMRVPLGFFLPDNDTQHEPVLSRREAELLEHFHAIPTKEQDAILTLIRSVRRC